jgi:hypothetical protein
LRVLTIHVQKLWLLRPPQPQALGKDLEFRSVIFIGLGQIESSETQAAQNMKLLYVGMTRAKERLLITASGRNEFTERLGAMVGHI